MVCLVRAPLDIKQRRLDTKERPVGFGCRPILSSCLLDRSCGNPFNSMGDHSEMARVPAVAIPRSGISYTGSRMVAGCRHVLSYIQIFQYLAFLGIDRLGNWSKKPRLLEETHNLGHLRCNQTSTICRGPHDVVGRKSHGYRLDYKYRLLRLPDSGGEN